MANTLTSNASYPKPIDESQVMQDMENLQSAFSTLCDQLEKNVAGIQTAADAGVNASIVNSGGKRIVLLQHLSAGSIATISNCVKGMPFTLVFQSVGSFGIVDVGNFVLSATALLTTGDTLTLVWDGTQYFEIARSAN